MREKKVPGDKIKVVHIGLPHLDRLTRLTPEKPPASDKIIFCYRGSGSYHKGLKFFLEAVTLLPEHVLARCGFIVRGIKHRAAFEPYRKKIPGLVIHSVYSVDDLPRFAGEYDVGVVPHLWRENSPLVLLEHLACGKPVLAARLGGVVDHVREKENGWFFESGDAGDLRQKIRMIVEGELPLPTFAMTPTAGCERFMRSLEDFS